MMWDKLDGQGKTWLFFGVVGAAVLWLLSPSGPPRPKRLPAPPPVRQAPKAPNTPPVNRGAVPAASAPGISGVVPVAPAPFKELLGQYAGREMVSNGRGTCVLRLELRRSDKEGEFSGFTNLVCAPTLGEVMAQNKKGGRGLVVDARNKAANATVATLTGTAVEGSIRLHAVKNFGVRDARDGCEMTALTVTPGGTDVIDVDWQESPEATGVCHGAQMQMKRVAR